MIDSLGALQLHKVIIICLNGLKGKVLEVTALFSPRNHNNIGKIDIASYRQERIEILQFTKTEMRLALGVSC